MTGPDADSDRNSKSDPDPELDRVTAAEIESHIVCPRQYEFEHERALSPRQSDRSLIRRRRRELLSDAIVAGLRAETDDPAERVASALERLGDRWGRQSTSSPYLVDAQEAYDQAVAREAIKSYFDEMGHEHAENAVAVDATLSYDLEGIRYEVGVDAVIERDGTALAVRYVPNFDGILNVNWYDDNIKQYRDGSKYFPRQIASFATAGLAIRSLQREYGLDARTDFAYISLVEDSRPAYRADDDVAVATEARHFRGQYEEEEGDLARLLAAKATAIVESRTDPTAAEVGFGDIRERSCSYCAYRDACPDRIRSEVSFAERTGSEPMTVEDAMRVDQTGGDSK